MCLRIHVYIYIYMYFYIYICMYMYIYVYIGCVRAFTNVLWRCHFCAMTHSRHVCAVTNPGLFRDPSINTCKLIHLCAMTHCRHCTCTCSFGCEVHSNMCCDSYTCVPWLFFFIMCAVMYTCMPTHTCMCND